MTATARRFGVRRALRALSSVMIVVGVILLVDAGVTLLWQEPVSAFLASRDQNTLERELSTETQRFGESVNVASARGPRERQALTRSAREFAARLDTGDAFGRVAMPTLKRSFVVAEGTDTETLQTGPGHYTGTGLPGMRRTVALAGHRTTYLAPFSDIDELKRGDPIVLTMPYGRFTYRVDSTRIVDPSAIWVTERGSNRLVLTSCHPPFSAAQRIVVFANLVTENRAR
jgi:sortase A